jgi:hypothetical protein
VIKISMPVKQLNGYSIELSTANCYEFDWNACRKKTS